MTRPLVVRFGALGDMVLMTVAIRRLAERFGSPVDILGSGEWTEPLLRGQSGVGDIYLLRRRRLPYWIGPEQWRLVRNLRGRGAGPTWLFDTRTEKELWLLKRSGWKSEHLLTLDGLPDIAGEHFCDRWRRFADLNPESIGPSATMDGASSQMEPAFPVLTLPETVRAESSPWLRELGIQGQPWILIQVGNKRTMRRGHRQRASNTKYWSEQNWSALLRGLRALHPEHALLLLGVVAEARLNDEILAMAKVDNAHNLARGMSVPRLMALSGGAAGMLSVDTGPAHVAAALGCPVLTLFDSPAKRTIYAPRGPGLFATCVVGGTDARPSMFGITPDSVLAAWQGMTRGKSIHDGVV
jgi:heptosyltransferase-2/heptosyltransferase-3